MKHGFTLIEVLIATAIASLLTVALFFSFTQLNNSVTKAGDTAHIFDAALLVDRVFFNDLLGAFIPVQAVPEKKKKKAAGGNKGGQADKKDEKNDTKEHAESSDRANEGNENEQKTKVPLLKDPFKSSNKSEQLYQFTFITANPVRVYWGEKTGDPKPSCVRVVYTLEEKKDRKKKEPRYQLYRQEGIKLELSHYLKEGEIERYLIADNIVSCKLKFIAAVEKQKEKEEGSAQDTQKQPAKKEPEKEQKPEIEIKEFNDWSTGGDDKDVRTRVMIPDAVAMTLVLSNDAETREQTFTLRFPIAAHFNEVPEQEAPRAAGVQAGKKPDADKEALKEKEKKEALANGANKIVQNLRTRFGRA